MIASTTAMARTALILVALAWVTGCGGPATKSSEADSSTTQTASPIAPEPPASSTSSADGANKPAEPALGLAEQELGKGLKSYDDGDYKSAARQLQASLNFGLSARADKVKAHKYLAFIHCVSSRVAACRGEFRKALAEDPQFVLEPAEAGHPIWGPAFRTVKAEPAKPAARK
jgi:hypothetical protein